MRRWMLRTGGLWLLLLPAMADAAPSGKPEGTCGRYGTNVEFVSTPSEAARQAKKDEKLVFVLHVSGYFEDPNLT